MKKTFGILALGLLLSLNVFSQKNNQVENKGEFNYSPRHEIRFNLLTTIIGLPELNYEYFIRDNIGLGLAVQASIEDFEETMYRGGVIPYGRFYFGRKPNSGFYIEGSAGLLYAKYYETYRIEGEYQRVLEKTAHYGVGVALGYKLLTKNNWVGDIHIGIGPVLSKAYFEAYPRFGISVGKRF